MAKDPEPKQESMQTVEHAEMFDFAATERGVDLASEDSLLELARTIELIMDCGPTYTRVRVDGHDVSEAIRTMAVSAATSEVARCEGVRAILVARQRETGEKLGSFVSEGRDQGRSFTSLGVALKKMLQRSAFRKTDLPVPVAPATSRCGICVRSLMTGLPKMSLPSGRVSFEEAS